MNGAEMFLRLQDAIAERGEGFSANVERDGAGYYIVAGYPRSFRGAQRVADTPYTSRKKAWSFLLFLFGVDGGTAFRLKAKGVTSATFVDPDGWHVIVWDSIFHNEVRHAFPEFAARHGIGESAQ